MPKYRFSLTVPVTATAEVEIEADSIEDARDVALQPSWYRDPANAKFVMDEENLPNDAYLPDEEDYEVVGDEASPSP